MLTISTPRRIISFFVLIISLFVSATFAASDTFNIIEADGALSITPLESQQALEEARQLLENNFIDYRVEDSSYRQSLGFIVVTETYRDKPAAAEDLKRLSDAGIKDYLFVARGDYINRISAGVFGTRTAAQTLATKLNQQGFAFQVIERFRTLGTRAIVIREALTRNELERILTGELLDREAPALTPTTPEPKSAAPEPIAATPAPSPAPETHAPGTTAPRTTAPRTTAPGTTAPEAPALDSPVSESVVSDPERADSSEPDVSETKPATLPVIVGTQPSRSSDGSWLWFLFGGIFLIIAGALAYYYLQRRNAEEAARPAAPKPAAPKQKPRNEPVNREPVTSEDVTQIRDVNVSTSPDAFYEYAEAMLEGRPGKSGSLTILGTEDTRITELINDLLLLSRLEEKTESVNTFAFDVRSLVDNLIDRLSLENPKGTAALKSSPDNKLPATLLMDAEKLNRVLAILVQNAIEKAASGVIDIHQFLDGGQLNTEIRYHPESKDAKEELDAITNPAKPQQSVSTAERIRFSIANRMTSVLGGRIDATMDKGEALIQVRLPATVVPSPLTSLPAGKTIEDLIAAEAHAKTEAEQAKRQAEQTQAEIDQAKSQAEESLRSSENALAELRDELEKARAAQSEELESVLSEKADAEKELNALGDQLASLNSELEETRNRLESEVNARSQLEADAQRQVKDLEDSLAKEQTRIEQEGQTLRAREEAAKAQVNQLEEQLTSMQSAMDSESKKALQVLREHLSEAEQQLTGETEKRAQAEEDARNQVKDLLQQLNGARELAEQATADKGSLQERLEQTTLQLTEAKTELEKKVARLESDSQSAQDRVDKLQAELTAATNAIEQEKQARNDAESEAKQQIAELEEKLSDAESRRESELADNEAKVTQANAEIEALTEKLSASEQQLEEQLEAAKQSSANAEVDNLHAELEAAREKLELEINRRNSAEASAGKQIEELLDELNLLRSDASSLAKERETLENEKQDEVESIRRELEEAQATLDAERNEKVDLQTRSEENLNELESRLKDMEAEHNKLQAQAERAEAFGQHQTSLLEQALSDAESANKLGDAARKVTQHLKAKIRKLENQVEELEANQLAPEPEPEPEQEAEAQSEPLSSDAEETSGTETEPSSLSLVPEAELVQQSEVEAAEEAEEQDKEPEEPEQPVLMLEALEEATEASFDPEPEAEPEPESEAAPVVEYEAQEETDFALDDFDDNDEPSEPTLVIEELEAEDSTPDPEPEPEPEPETVPEPELAPETEAEIETQSELTLVEEEPQDEQHQEEQQETIVDEEPSPEALVDAPDEAEEAEDEEDLEYEIQFDDKPIRSTRPINNPVLHSMIERFVKQLSQHIDAMETALANRDYLELVVSCNWVRGEANTLGFEVLLKPVDSIELQLRREKFSQIITHLSELRNMAERIEIKQSASPDAPIQYFVPAGAKNAVIYENFVSQLGSKLLELEVAASSDNTRQMTQLCKWINRYGTKIKFIEVVDAANQLQEVIETGDDELIEEQLKRFIDIYAKIEIVFEEEA